MALTRKAATTRLDFDRLEYGSLIVEGVIIEGPAQDVVAALTALMGRESEHGPSCGAGEPFPES